MLSVPICFFNSIMRFSKKATPLRAKHGGGGHQAYPTWRISPPNQSCRGCPGVPGQMKAFAANRWGCLSPNQARRRADQVLASASTCRSAGHQPPSDPAGIGKGRKSSSAALIGGCLSLDESLVTDEMHGRSQRSRRGDRRYPEINEGRDKGREGRP
jgi:hypothetical protein